MKKTDAAKKSKEIVNSVEDAGRLLEYHNNCIKALYERGVEQFLLKYVGREKGRQFLYIQLWTPAWNDGEECVHTHDYCIGPEIIEYEYFENEEDIFRGIDKKEIEQSAHLTLEERDIQGVIKTLEYKYETDKQCLIILGGNEKIVSITKDYSCGY